MVSSRKIAIALLFVLLPTFIFAARQTQCKVTVSQKLTDRSNRYYTYQGTLTNVGSSTVTNVILTPSADLADMYGLSSEDDVLSYTGSLAAGDSYSFTYSVRKGTTVSWTNTLSCGATTPTATPTKTPTSAPTKVPTAAPTSATKAPTSAPTTKAPTSAPTKAPTSAPTKAPTSAPTTKAPTNAPTSAPTKAPTSAPTKASSSATTAPSTGAGKRCPAGTWWAPAPQTTWQWQLTGTIDQSINVQMYDIDLFDSSAATISSLHAAGRTVICYFSTQYENWRPDAQSFPAAALGSNLDNWAGERYIDIRNAGVRAVLAARLDLAVSKGCDGVEPDNVDGYSASSGFPLKAADQIDFNKFLATEAHARGLSIGLKNDLSQATALEPYFDWALNEQCAQYGECSMLNVFVQNGKAVFNTEYSGSGSSVCPSMVNSKFSSLVKKLALDASISAQCCTYQSGGCVAVPYRCVSSSS